MSKKHHRNNAEYERLKKRAERRKRLKEELEDALIDNKLNFR